MYVSRGYNSTVGLDILFVQPISKAQAWQRSGRAGREGPGICYRLYTEEAFEKLSEQTVPEIQRCELSNVLLQLLALKITDIVGFDFMDKPSHDALVNALEQLNLVGAVEEKDKIVLTPLGWEMVQFPLHPQLSKVILQSREYNCRYICMSNWGTDHDPRGWA